MHSKDRTLLAQMGFADPDRKETRHELAIQYLVRPDVAEAMTTLLNRGSAARINFMMYDGNEGDLVSETQFSHLLRVSTEVHIGKGEGKFRNTVGFLDIEYDVAVRKANERNDDGKHPFKYTSFRQVVEVKINPVPTSDLIRQINLYREYHSAFRWVAALAYSISEEDAQLLKMSNIRHIRIGDKFTQYVQARKTDSRESEAPEV